MEFFDGNTTDEKHLLGDRMCGSRSPLIFESSGQMLSIVFNSDKSVTFRGFRAEWKTEKISKQIYRDSKKRLLSLKLQLLIDLAANFTKRKKERKKERKEKVYAVKTRVRFWDQRIVPHAYLVRF